MRSLNLSRLDVSDHPLSAHGPRPKLGDHFLVAEVGDHLVAERGAPFVVRDAVAI